MLKKYAIDYTHLVYAKHADIPILSSFNEDEKRKTQKQMKRVLRNLTSSINNTVMPL